VTRRVERDDRGVVLPMFVLLLVALIGMAAIVIDLAALRLDVRLNRAAADLAATAGAEAMNTLSGGTPYAGCTETWLYLEKNLGLSPAGDPCSSFPQTTCNASSEITQSKTAGAYTVTVINPVSDSDSLMAFYHQTTNESEMGDGTPCERIGVTINETRPYTFGRLYATNGGTTIHAVARFSILGGELYPAIATLDQHGCSNPTKGLPGGIDAASAIIHAFGVSPSTSGIIYSDSDGTGSLSLSTPVPCTTGDPVVNSQGSGYIEADGPSTYQPGKIGLYGLNTLSPAVAYSGTTSSANPCVAGTFNICPTPTVLPTRITRTPIDTIYHCSKLPGANPCNGAADPIQDLVATYHSGVGTIPSGNTVSGSACTVSGTQTFTQDEYFNCSSLYIKGTGSTPAIVNLLAGGTYVFAGTVDVENNGYLNVISGVLPVSSQPGGGITATTCPTSVGDTILYIRSPGGFTAATSGTANLCNTFMYAEGDSGSTSGGLITLGSSDNVFWRPSHATTSGFAKLMFWSEGSGTTSIPSTTSSNWQGGANLDMDGILFSPNTWLLVGGNGAVNAKNVQMWWDALQLNGHSVVLNLAPDPNNATPITGGISLIR